VGQSLVAYGGSAGGPASGTVGVVQAPAATVVPTVSPVPMNVGGTVLTTNAPPGAQVEVVDSSSGEVLASGTAPSSGVLGLTLSSPATGSQHLQVVVDGVPQGPPVVPSGVGSAPTVVNGVVLVEGSVVTARGVPGDIVQVVDSQGRVLGSGTVDASGNVAVRVSGAVAGADVFVVQDGVAVKLSQPAEALGSAQVFVNTNIFKPNQGGTLAIGFKALADDSITMKVFNISGERVRMLVDMDVANGTLYSQNWDGRNDSGELVASGVYIVSVYGRHTRTLKKVVVMK